jgi:hypothetical protein
MSLSNLMKIKEINFGIEVSIYSEGGREEEKIGNL